MKCPRSMMLYLTTRCDQKCRHCLVRDSYPGDADKQLSMQIVHEFAGLGGKYVDLTGGNPALVSWLPDILQLCNALGLYSSVTLSGSAILKAQDYLELPTLLRLSIDGCSATHDANRGHGSYAKILDGSELVRSKRTGLKTQLIFTAIPGRDGNLNHYELKSVLSMARSFGLLVNVNPLFGISSLTSEEIALLRWFGKQAGVQMSRGKLQFILRGGNNIYDPTCRAIQNTLTVAPDGTMVLPCFHQRRQSIDLRNGLKAALSSPVRLQLIPKDGRFSFCSTCSIWCYIVPSMLTPFGFPRLHDRVLVWLHGLSGLQKYRDTILRWFGVLHASCPYPNFRLP